MVPNREPRMVKRKKKWSRSRHSKHINRHSSSSVVETTQSVVCSQRVSVIRIKRNIEVVCISGNQGIVRGIIFNSNWKIVEKRNMASNYPPSFLDDLPEWLMCTFCAENFSRQKQFLFLFCSKVACINCALKSK